MKRVITYGTFVTCYIMDISIIIKERRHWAII